MQKDLERRLDELDGRRDALLNDLAVESPGKLAFRPGGNGWCALDVVQHLVLVEEGVVGYARKKLLGAPQPVAVLDRARLVLLVLVLRSPARFAAPAAQVVPEATLPLDELAARWRRTRGELRDLVLALPGERRGSLFFRHPLAGPLDPGGTLTFVREHARHHGAQLRRIWRSPGCPA